mmetsp:Transcript_99718/g.177531  ORF Transcript_99718/g.177531 Transcript_99718/m.177531 type:complete len:231 (+) Transcript_99718:917-1609(+)
MRLVDMFEPRTADQITKVRGVIHMRCPQEGSLTILLSVIFIIILLTPPCHTSEHARTVYLRVESITVFLQLVTTHENSNQRRVLDVRCAKKFPLARRSSSASVIILVRIAGRTVKQICMLRSEHFIVSVFDFLPAIAAADQVLQIRRVLHVHSSRKHLSTRLFPITNVVLLPRIASHAYHHIPHSSCFFMLLVIIIQVPAANDQISHLRCVLHMRSSRESFLAPRGCMAS